jgi:hypothetical protein
MQKAIDPELAVLDHGQPEDNLRATALRFFTSSRLA